jgi:hypothetical protein
MSAKTTCASGGMTLGSLLAVLLSWTVNHSILFCIVHFFCSWAYVIYWSLVYGKL